MEPLKMKPHGLGLRVWGYLGIIRVFHALNSLGGLGKCMPQTVS